MTTYALHAGTLHRAASQHWTARDGVSVQAACGAALGGAGLALYVAASAGEAAARLVQGCGICGECEPA